MANKLRRIKTPWVQQWRRVRYQLLPVVVFVGAGSLAVWLWSRQVGLPHAVGEVSAVRADAVSPADGKLAHLEGEPLKLFDKVQQGDVIGRLDAGQAEAMVVTSRKELLRLQKEYEATRAQISDEQEQIRKAELAERRRLNESIESLRRQELTLLAQIKPDEVQLPQLREQVSALKGLVGTGVEPKIKLIEAEGQLAVVEKRIQANRESLGEIQEQMAKGKARLENFRETQLADLEKRVAPLLDAAEVQKARIDELQAVVARLEIQAPISGTVMAIHRWAGQNVLAGDPVMTIAAADSSYIVSYLRQEVHLKPVVGMTVEVSVRSLPRRRAMARVEEVGPQYELVPQHQLRDPAVAEWGLPVRISVPDVLGLRPGELVDVAFKPGVALGATAGGGERLQSSGEVVSVVSRSVVAGSAD